jgi:hypothetical protein
LAYAVRAVQWKRERARSGGHLPESVGTAARGRCRGLRPLSPEGCRKWLR